MASVLLGSVTGSGGGGVVHTISIGNSVAVGSSGELFNVDPGQGKRVVITGLAPQTGSESNIDITFDVRSVYTGTIADDVSQSQLTVMQGYPNTSTNEYQGVGTISQIKGGINEVLSITKTSGTTGLIVYLSYIITD